MSNPFAPTKAIPIPGTSTTLYVRGIAMEDVSALLQKHGAALTVLYSRYAQKDMRVDNNMVKTAMGEVIQDMPKLAASILFHATDGVAYTLPPQTEEDVQNGVQQAPVEITAPEAMFSKLAMPVQTEALLAVSELTFVGENALEKFFATLTKMMEGVVVAVTEVTKSTLPISGVGTETTARS